MKQNKEMIQIVVCQRTQVNEKIGIEEKGQRKVGKRESGETIGKNVEICDIFAIL